MRKIDAKKKLHEQVKNNNAICLNRSAAYFSHKIFKGKGSRGHNIRQNIRKELKSGIREFQNNRCCPKCLSSNFQIKSGFHFLGINKYICLKCGKRFTNPSTRR